jgi:hypothetical protein
LLVLQAIQSVGRRNGARHHHLPVGGYQQPNWSPIYPTKIELDKEDNGKEDNHNNEYAHDDQVTDNIEHDGDEKDDHGKHGNKDVKGYKYMPLDCTSSHKFNDGSRDDSEIEITRAAEVVANTVLSNEGVANQVVDWDNTKQYLIIYSFFSFFPLTFDAGLEDFLYSTIL